MSYRLKQSLKTQSGLITHLMTLILLHPTAGIIMRFGPKRMDMKLRLTNTVGQRMLFFQANLKQLCSC